MSKFECVEKLMSQVMSMSGLLMKKYFCRIIFEAKTVFVKSGGMYQDSVSFILMKNLVITEGINLKCAYFLLNSGINT